jgi:hypothetical protein
VEGCAGLLGSGSPSVRAINSNTKCASSRDTAVSSGSSTTCVHQGDRHLGQLLNVTLGDVVRINLIVWIVVTKWADNHLTCRIIAAKSLDCDISADIAVKDVAIRDALCLAVVGIVVGLRRNLRALRSELRTKSWIDD